MELPLALSLLYAVLSMGALILIPVGVIALALFFGAIGAVVSLIERSKWRR